MTISTTDFWMMGALLLFLVLLPLWAIRQRLKHLEQRVGELMNPLQARGSAEPSAHVRALAADPRNKIEAIKAYRQQTGAGLREAKAAVERLSGHQQNRW